MVLVLTFLLFLTVFLLVVDFFTILFRLTGLPIEKARFQVISLLTSTGFTTKESEIITQHPARRKLAAWLMIFSYASTATFISFLIKILGNIVVSKESLGFTFASVILFIVIVYFFQKSSMLEKLENTVEKFIMTSNKFVKFLGGKTIVNISAKKGYGIYHIYLSNTSPLVGKSIKESGLKEIEVQILNIDKGDKLLNFPSPDYVFDKSDKLTVYGNIKNIKKTFNHTSAN
ncbi:MAG: TrkA C-terminal domain-containing protein [Sarcina sp.]